MNRSLALLPAFLLFAAPARSLPSARPAPTEALVETARREIAAQPDGKATRELLAALEELRAGALKASPAERDAWIGAHLGTFNETLRTTTGAPETVLAAAARAAARLNAAAQRWTDAREFAEKALASRPDDADALVSRSRANAGLADYARAYADAERAAKLAPDAAAAYSARAGAAYGLGNYMQALEDARQALVLDPDDRDAFALMKLSQGRAQKGPAFDEKEAPRLADSVEREYHGLTEQANQAEEQRRNPPREPGPSAAARLTASAGAKIAVKDYWGAVADADKALAADPADVSALYFRAAAHNLAGDYGEAARDASRGLILRPSNAPLHDARAWAYNRMGRFREAIADAHGALEADPQDAYAFANRAYAEERSGDFPAMAEDYRAAAGLDAQFEATYADAARRHGLTPEPARADAAPAKPNRRARSFAAVAAAAALGGVLIAFGALRADRSRRAAPDAPPLPPGLEGAYTLGRPLGQGGMGVVYEAFDRRLKRDVAIKMLRDEFKLDDAAKADFMAEARTVAELHHPSIVDIHGIVEDERGLYLIFERLEGRTLDQVLAEKKRLPLSEIKRVLEPVCAALEYAHARDVVHRDLKPSNVMLLKDGGIKVLDFGISRHAARAGKAPVTQTVVGTPHYMAPEQEDGVIRRESDVFSLGAVLYEMVTGARPYEGPRQIKLVKGYIRVSTRAPGVPPALETLIDRALEPEPEKRIPSPAEFRRQLASVPDFEPLAV